MSAEDNKETVEQEETANVAEEQVVEGASEDQTPEEDMFKKKKKEGGVEDLQARISELENEVGEAKDKYIRLYAEFDNYKKRTIKERYDLISTAGRDTISALLPVLDDFDRAKGAAEDDASSEQFSEGVTLVYNKLHGMLKAKGVAPMESTGEVFDPEIHEAITEIPAPNDEMKGKIIDTIEKGYTLNDKIIRHAKVVVGK